MVIVGVVTNPGEEEEEIISLQDAVQRRRLDLGQGVYWHPTQRQFISMVEAMNNGWIKASCSNNFSLVCSEEAV